MIRSGEEAVLPTGSEVGRPVTISRAVEEYISFLTESCPVDLSGYRIVLDCANGASSFVAPEVFRRLGAQVLPYYNLPDGININAGCGSCLLYTSSWSIKKVGAFMRKLPL